MQPFLGAESFTALLHDAVEVQPRYAVSTCFPEDETEVFLETLCGYVDAARQSASICVAQRAGTERRKRGCLQWHLGRKRGGRTARGGPASFLKVRAEASP